MSSMSVNKGTGGPASNVLMYVVALVMVFTKWNHLSLNSKLLSRYDGTKLTPTRTFSANLYGK